MKSFISWVWNDLLRPAVVEIACRVASELIDWATKALIAAATRWIDRLLGWSRRLVARGADERDVRVIATNRVVDALAAVAAKAEMLRDTDGIDEVLALMGEQEGSLDEPVLIKTV